MWLSKDLFGTYRVHKSEPILIDKWESHDRVQHEIPEWLSVELCNKYNVNRPTIGTVINLPTHKARRYSFSWFLLLTREWADLKKCLK